MLRKWGAMGQGGGGITLFSSPSDIIVLVLSLDTKHGLFSGNAGLRSDVDHDMEGRSCCRQGSICQNRARGIVPKTRARSPSLLHRGRWRRRKPRAGDRTTRAGGGAVFARLQGVRPRYSGQILYRLGRRLDVALEGIGWAACAENGVRNGAVPVSAMVCVQSERLLRSC
jgi:hypothetical protein